METQTARVPPARPGILGRILMDRLAPVYAIGVVGALLQVVGGFWDVAWHVLGIVETFFTPPHTVLYTGIAIVALAGAAGLGMRFISPRSDGSRRRLLLGLHIALVGTALQVVAGPFDFWWHSTYGFDPFLFTPAHSLLIAGIIVTGVGLAIGSVRILQARRDGIDVGRPFGSLRWLQLGVVVALTVLWLDLNSLVYLLTDTSGIAYTFRLGPSFVEQFALTAFLLGTSALAFTGTLIFLSAKRVLGWTGSVTAVALLAAVVSATVNIGFRAWSPEGTSEGPALAAFLPIYLAFVAPVALFDVAMRPSLARPWVILAAVLVSPFASLLDGWNASFLWTEFFGLLPPFVAAMLPAGLVAGLLHVRFERALRFGRAVRAVPFA